MLCYIDECELGYDNKQLLFRPIRFRTERERARERVKMKLKYVNLTFCFAHEYFHNNTI